MEKIQKKPSLSILLLLASFGIVSSVLFTPGLPQIAQRLGINDVTAQLTITVFLIGYALGFLPYGPFSDRFGRKPAIYLGVSIAILGCLLILLVEKFHSFPFLLFGRLLLALGSSVGLKIAFTMIGETYQHERATKAITYLMLSFAVAPSLAVGIGGLLTTHFGWESCFYFQTGYSIFVLIMAFFLPETCLKTDLHALKIKSIASGYLQKVKNKKVLLCGMMMGCGISIVYLFAAEAPFIGIARIGLPPAKYGLFNFIPAAGFVTGALFANVMAGKKSQRFILLLGITITITCTALMLLIFQLGLINPWSLFIPTSFIYIGESLVYVNAASLVLSHAKNKSYASAMMNFLAVGSAVITLFLFDSIPQHGVSLMPLTFTALAILMLVLLGGLWRIVKSNPPALHDGR